jgi:hypothetical protein
MKAFTVCALLLLGFAAANAQECRVFKSFNAAVNTKNIQDTVLVSDSFPVTSVKVLNVVLGFPAVSDLEMSILHR